MGKQHRMDFNTLAKRHTLLKSGASVGGSSHVGVSMDRGGALAIYGTYSILFFVIGINLSATENHQVSYLSPSFL